VTGLVLAAMACPVCFSQAAESPLVEAAMMGVLALLIVTVGVLGGFIAFIRHLAKLSRKAEAPGGWGPRNYGGQA
jgi:predicted transporter